MFNCAEIGGGICYRYLLATIDKVQVIPKAPLVENIKTSGFYNGSITGLVKNHPWMEWGNKNSITIEFSDKVNAIGLVHQSAVGGNRWTSYVSLQYSDDGVNYETLGEQGYSSGTTNVLTNIWNSKGKHKYWKMILNSYVSNWQGYMFDLIVKL